MVITTSTFAESVIFGDSLSDGGNVGLATLNQQQRFTTNPGYTTAEYVADKSTSPSLLGGENYAWGGATVTHLNTAVPSITEQVNSYLQKNIVKSNTLYQIWGGANDIFYLTQQSDASEILNGIKNAAQAETQLIKNLSNAGAKTIIVYNLPDIGATPRALQAGTTVSGQLSQLTQLYNYTLNENLAKNTVAVNVYAALNEIRANPELYGFKNVTEAKCGALSSLICTASSDDYLFADGIHPTDQTHFFISQMVKSELTAPSYMALLAEAPKVILNTQQNIIRQQIQLDAQGGETRPFININYNSQNIQKKLSTHDTDLTVGTDIRISEHLSTGIGLNIGRQNGTFTQNFGDYKLNHMSGLFFTTYQLDPYYIGISAQAGTLKYKDIHRNIELGATTRTESGDVQGYNLSTTAEIGALWDFEALKTGPVASVTSQKIHLNKYNEHSQDSTAMWFSQQNNTALISRIGWHAQTEWQLNDYVISPMLETAWYHDYKASNRQICAGLNTLNGEFDTQINGTDKDWGAVHLGVSASVGKEWSTWIILDQTFSQNSNSEKSVNLGMQYKF